MEAAAEAQFQTFHPRWNRDRHIKALILIGRRCDRPVVGIVVAGDDAADIPGHLVVSVKKCAEVILRTQVLAEDQLSIAVHIERFVVPAVEPIQREADGAPIASERVFLPDVLCPGVFIGG